MSVKLKQIFSDKQFYIFLLIILLFFGIFIKTNFSVDTYQLVGSDNMSYISIYKEDGRLIHYLILNIFNFLKLNINAIHVIIFLFATIFSTFSLYFLNNILKKYIKNPFICALISILIIINPFSIELWLFTEMAIMQLSILCCVLAFGNFDSFLEKKEKKYILYSIIFMLIALFSYQGTVAIFIALSSLLIIKYSTNIKQFILNNFLLGVCYALPTITNFLIAKLMGTTRLNLGSNIAETFTFIIKPALNVLTNSFWILPEGVFGACIIVALLMTILSISLIKDRFSKKLKLLLGLAYVVLMTYLFTVLPLFAQSSESFSLFPRSTYAFGSIIGIILAYSFINCNNTKIYTKIIIVLSVILLSIQFIMFNNLATNRFMVNYMDKYIAYEINEKIKEYEKNTGNIIRNVAFYNLQNSQKFYPELNDMLNVSARTEKMSSFYLTRYFTQKSLNMVNSDESVYNNYFRDQNWTLFDPNQIVLKDNTLHLYIY